MLLGGKISLFELGVTISQTQNDNEIELCCVCFSIVDLLHKLSPLSLYLSAMHDCLSISNNLILNRMHSKYVRVCVYVDFAVVIVCDKLINYFQHF